MQRVTWDTVDAFTVVEKMLPETFFPCLFLGNTKTLSSIIGAPSKTPVNKSGLGILNPVTSPK